MVAHVPAEVLRIPSRGEGTEGEGAVGDVFEWQRGFQSPGFG